MTTEYDENGHQIVYVQRDKDCPEVLVYIDPCSNCGKYHRHGACGSFDFGAGNGTRAAHCFDGKSSEVYIKEVNTKRRKEMEEQFDKLGLVYRKANGKMSNR